MTEISVQKIYVTKTEGGFAAATNCSPYIYTEGATEEAALDRIKQAFTFYLEHRHEVRTATTSSTLVTNTTTRVVSAHDLLAA